MSTTTLAVLVPLLPFLGAFAGFAAGRRAPGFVRPLAVLPTLAATALAVVIAIKQADGGAGTAITAATQLTPTGNELLPVSLAFHLDGFAVLVAVLVGLVATCVQLYSTGYLRDDPRYASYASLVSLFTAAMLLVVYSDDLIVLLVGWEIMGICSYFLVGHYWEKAAARSASLKAFLVTKLGDVPFLIGILALASEAGTFRISTIVARLTSSLSDFELSHPTVIALLLLAGVVGKSAQFPLHSWLPDAMAGPTPVSALIHAATMVAAGVYFVARLLPVFTASSAALIVLGVLAAVTMVGSALAALAQDDLKRVLAYSTIGQLGYMAGALAVGYLSAATFHLLSHGAFKALLFLTAGVLITAAGTGSLAAMARVRGLKKRAPDAFWTMTIGLLALAAIPPFSGFFSKEAVLGAAEHAAFEPDQGIPASAGWIVLLAGLVTALLTASYATRLWLLAWQGPDTAASTPHGPAAPEGDQAPTTPSGPATEPTTATATAPTTGTATATATAPSPPATSPPATSPMNAVLWLLAIPSLGFGLLYGWVGDRLDGASLAPTLTTSVLATGVALVGALVTYATWRHTAALSRDPDPAPVLLGPLLRPARAGFHLDALYDRAFVAPVRGAARVVNFLDREVVDAYVRGAAHVPGWLGTALRRAQTGNAQTYLSALLAGAIILVIAVLAAGA